MIDNQNIGIERATTLQNSQVVQSGGGGDINNTSSNIGGSFKGSSQKRTEKTREFSCENRGFQHYLLGLSQIQLGKPGEANKNFIRATNLSRVLYDAHYRIGLISILKKCKKKCTVKKEIEMRHQHLKKSIKEAQG